MWTVECFYPMTGWDVQKRDNPSQCLARVVVALDELSPATAFRIFKNDDPDAVTAGQTGYDVRANTMEGAN